MPMFIHGWIEVTGLAGVEQEEEHAWRGLINLGSLLMDETDAVSERLFALSKHCVCENVRGGLAVARGVPRNPSEEVRRELGEIGAFEEKYGPGEVGGYTWASWNEISTVHFETEELTDSRWAVAFALANTLTTQSYVTPDQLRFVVWYSW